MKYSLVHLYGTHEIAWAKVPVNKSAPEIGSESHEHTYLSHFEGGVVIANIEGDSDAGRILSLVDHLGSIVEAQSKRGMSGGSSYEITGMLVDLMRIAAMGFEATAAKRAEVERLMEDDATPPLIEVASEVKPGQSHPDVPAS